MTAPDGLPSPQRGKAVLVIVLGIAMSVMDGSIVNLALPGIARQLQAEASQAIWVVNAYQIASLVMLLPLAALGDRLGYRRVYLVGMVLFVLSSIAAMLANSLPMLTAARALQGLGAAGIMSVNTALVRLIYPSHRLGAASPSTPWWWPRPPWLARRWRRRSCRSLPGLGCLR